LAAVNVQNRVTTVLDELPEEVIKAGVVTEKEVNSMLLYLNIVSSDSTVDEKFIYNFADINVLAELKRIDGVGFAAIMGSRDYAMRVWLKPDRMTVYEVSAADVVGAFAGRTWRLRRVKQAKVLTVTRRRCSTCCAIRQIFEPKQYENLILRTNTDGSLLRLKDVADVEFGSLDYGILSKTDGQTLCGYHAEARPGSNARDVIANVKTRMAELKKSAFHRA
jgi:multidrug efflux pump subunit AcrB